MHNAHSIPIYRKIKFKGTHMINSSENSNSEQLAELFSALSKAQGKINNAVKDSSNPFFKSSYTSLTSVWDACRDVLSSQGLTIIQTVEGTKAEMVLITWLGHSSGQWIKSKLPLMIVKADAQGVGSAITYARRYALAAIVGVCQEDDDGEKSIQRKSETQNSNIKKQDIEDLKILISECSPEYQISLNNTLMKQKIQLDQINQLTYERIFARASQEKIKYKQHIEDENEELKHATG